MSLRNRARKLQDKTGLGYQQALATLRKLCERPAQLSKQTGWPLEVCDRFLVDGHAPIEVIELRRPTREELILEVCHTLRATSNARSVLLASDSFEILAHVGDGNIDRTVLTRIPAVKQRLAKLLDTWETGDALVLLSARVKQATLVVKFHRDETSLGLVRLRVKKAVEELERLLSLDDGSPGLPPMGSAGGAGGAPAEARAALPGPPEAPPKKPKPRKSRKKR